MGVVAIKRFDICIVSLDPTKGSELKKTRPCIIISPDSMNSSFLKTIIIAPLTSKIRHNFPTRLLIKFQGKEGQVALDQLRVIDRSRIVKNAGAIKSSDTQKKILHVLQTLFS